MGTFGSDASGTLSPEQGSEGPGHQQGLSKEPPTPRSPSHHQKMHLLSSSQNHPELIPDTDPTSV